MARRCRKARKARPIPSLTARNLQGDVADDTEYYYDPLQSLRIHPRHEVVECGFFLIPPFPYDPTLFARDLDNFGKGTSVVLDSNFFLAETSQNVWDAIFGNEQLILFDPIVDEIQNWLKDPRGVNIEAHRVISSMLSKDNSSPVGRRSERFWELRKGLEWYINLLGVRKDVRTGLRSEHIESGTTLSDNSSLNHEIRKKFGERTQRLAISGDTPPGDSNRYNDEAIVILSIFHALISRRNTILITHDENVFEQFRRACWLVDTHYRSLRLIEAFKDDPFQYWPLLRTKDQQTELKHTLSMAFQGDVVLFRKPSAHLVELLPRFRTLVPIHCCLVRELNEILSFGLLNGHLDVFKWKSTVTANPMENCHIDLRLLSKQLNGLAAIGVDRVAAKGSFSFPIVDLNLVLGNHDRFTRHIPTNILTP